MLAHESLSPQSTVFISYTLRSTAAKMEAFTVKREVNSLVPSIFYLHPILRKGCAWTDPFRVCQWDREAGLFISVFVGENSSFGYRGQFFFSSNFTC